VYPFASFVGGEWVRGQRSYNHALQKAFKRYGHGHYGARLMLYRSIFHITGSLSLLTGAAFISQYFFGSTATLYVVLLITAAFIAFQEFYLQRKIQTRRKAVVDWFAWVSPIAVYLFFHQ